MPRKPNLAKAEAAIDPSDFAEENRTETVTAKLKGVEVHLGDGRKLAFGESAAVSPDIAKLLRAKGLA